MERTIKKGRHWSFPILRKVNPSFATFVVRTDSYKDWEYFIDGADQFDFNKLIGAKRKLFQPQRNSMMIGWRYNPALLSVEFLPYYHLNNGEARFCEHNTLRVPLRHMNKSVRVVFRGDSVSVAVGTFSKEWDTPDVISRPKAWVIAPWFGGQKKAPKDFPFKVYVA